MRGQARDVLLLHTNIAANIFWENPLFFTPLGEIPSGQLSHCGTVNNMTGLPHGDSGSVKPWVSSGSHDHTTCWDMCQ